MNHVLVIDDDHVLVDLLREFLATEGFTVDVAYDYATGLAGALDGEHELVVLDVVLPDGSGLELLKTLRASSKLPVLLLSAVGETVDRIIGIAPLAAAVRNDRMSRLLSRVQVLKPGDRAPCIRIVPRRPRKGPLAAWSGWPRLGLLCFAL